MPVKQILNSLVRFVRAAVDPVEEAKIRWLPAAWLGMLLILGGAAWGWFFDWGNFPVEFHD